MVLKGSLTQHSLYLSHMNMDLSRELQDILQRPGNLCVHLAPPPLAAEERTRVEVKGRSSPGSSQGSGLCRSVWRFILRCMLEIAGN